MKNLFFLLAVVFLVQSCSIQKRHYRPGLDIQWNKNTTVPEASPVKDVYLLTEEEQTTDVQPPAGLVADGSNRVFYAPTVERPENKKDDSCDVVIKMNGDEISAMVLRITESAIEYKRCDLPDGPLYVVNRSSVFMIKFSNGAKEVIHQPHAPEEKEEERIPGRIIHPLSTMSVIGLLVSAFALAELPGLLLLTLPLTLAFAIIGLVQSIERPGEFLPVSKVFSIISLVAIGLLGAVFLGALL